MIALRNWLELQAIRVYSRLIARSFHSYAPSRVHPTARIDNPECISLAGVRIGRGVWLYAITVDSAGHHYRPEMIIGTGTDIGSYCHITCANRLEIGKDVLIAQSVFIADSNHVYSDPNLPVHAQGLASKPVSIGEGSWLGNHSAILACSIGQNCVVGANAVVTRDVPDFSVVAGVPARVIKRYDPAAGAWVRPV